MRVLEAKLQAFMKEMAEKFQKRDGKHGKRSVTNDGFDWVFNEGELEDHLIREIGEWLASRDKSELVDIANMCFLLRSIEA